MESIMDIETPWGKSQTIDLVAEGILIVTTASHGGILLSPNRAAAMPGYMKRPLFAELFAPYEEDCDWCMPVLIFEAEFRAYYAARSIEADDALRDAHTTFRHWHPDAYEVFHGVTLQPGESHKRDEQRFYAANKDSLLTIAAYGDWKDGVPKGMVAVSVRPGGRANTNNSPTRYFLVPKDEYKPIDDFPFIVDPARHREIAPFD